MAGQGSAGNVVAALCSFFVPGLGQLLQGRLVNASAWVCVEGKRRRVVPSSSVSSAQIAPSTHETLPLASRPRTLPSASTTHQRRSISESFGV